ncbi:hypothetical protein [Rhizobium sp.]|jgi:hypothetical protein|uniref:hypothetical protein n=1 Tax=Rhizobium sp. TaxID=391 RepID=UPI000E80D745|nr:hypothetical protein [Rhizobium sp.]
MTKTPEEIVSICVESHAIVDRHLDKAYKRQQVMIDAIEDGLAVGMIADGSAAKQFAWGHRLALGKIAEAGKILADLHPIGTQHAKDNGADLGRITEAAGITLPQPEVSTFSGTR